LSPLRKNVAFCDDAYACAEGASALVIVTEREQFRALDFARLKAVMKRPLLVYLRNIYRPRNSRTTAPFMKVPGGPKVRIKHNEYFSVMAWRRQIKGADLARLA
jgi:hypothetical protein